MTFPHVLSYSMVVLACLPGALLRAAEPAQRHKFSPHITEAIQAGYRKDDGSPPPAPVHAALVPGPVEPGVLVLPVLTVSERREVKLDKAALTPKTEAIPLVLGTGISSYRNGNVLVRRIFFIPIAVKIKF